MNRPVVTADVIAALRARVVGHNERHPAARTRLNDLKKIFSRRGMGAVDGHLSKLAKASGDFDESKVRRDDDGRFAPKGGGTGRQGWQERLYSDVSTPEGHKRLRDDSRGYESATTAVIPETRFTEYGQYGGALAGLAAGGWAGASAMRNPEGGFVRRWARGKVADLAGGLAGGTVKSTMRAAGAASNAIFGKPADEAANRVAVRAGDATQRGVSRLVSGVGSAINRATTWPARKAAEAEVAGLPPPRNAVERARRAYRAAYAGTRYGAVWPGIPFAIAGYYGMRDYAGPLLDATFPRRVEKALTAPADPRSVEVLQKAAIGAAWRGAKGKIARLFARTPSQKAAATRSAKASAEQAEAARYDRLGTTVGRARMRRAGAYGLGGLGLAAIGGAALGGAGGAAAGYGGAMAARRYYRDDKGRFTSKEKDVGDRGPKDEGLSARERGAIGGLAAGGAVAGALLGAQFIRGRNAAVARRILEGLPGTNIVRGTPTGEISTTVPASFMAPRSAQTKRPDLALGQMAVSRRVGPEPTITADTTIGGAKAQTARTPFTGNPPPAGSPDYQALPVQERIALMRDRARQRAEINLRRKLDPAIKAAERRSRATTDALRTAWQSSDPADWANLQVDLALRDRLRGLAAAKSGFYEKGQAPDDWKRLKSALTSKVLVGKDGKVTKPDALSDLMNGNYDGYPLTDRQKGIIDKLRGEADTARAAYKAKIDALDDIARQKRKDLAELSPTIKEKSEALATRRSRLEEAEQAVKDGGESPIKNLDRYRSEITKLEAEVTDLQTRRDALIRETNEAMAALKPEKAPPIENPWARTTFLTPRPADNDALQRILTSIESDELKGLNEQIASGMAAGAANVDRAAAAAERVYRNALRGVRETDGTPMGFQRARDLMNRLGPPLRSFSQDALRLGGEVKDAVASRLPSVATVRDKATAAGAGAMDAARWANRNAKELLVAGATGTAIATTLGMADQSEDGEVNLRFDRAKDIPAHLVDPKTRPRPVNFIRNPGEDSEVRLSLIAAPNLNGERIVVSGVRILKDKDGKQIVQEIPAGSRVKEVVAATNRMAQQRAAQSQQKQGGGAKVGVAGLSDDDKTKLHEAIGAARAKGGLVRIDELGDDAFEIRNSNTNGETAIQQPAQDKLLPALLAASKDLRNGGKVDVRNWYEHAARLTDGEFTPALNASQMQIALLGRQGQPGLFSEAVRNAANGSDKNIFARKLAEDFAALPAPRDDQQARAMRRIVGFFQYQSPRAEMRLTEGQANIITSRFKAGGGGSSPSPAANTTAAPAAPPPAPTVHTTPRGATVEAFDHDTARKETSANVYSELISSYRMPQNERTRQMVEAAISEIEKDWGGIGPGRVGAEPAWWGEVEAEAVKRLMGKIPARPKKLASWAAGDLRKASQALLRKAAEEGIPGQRRPYDEGKIRRHPRGDDRGGEFAPKAGGGDAPRPRQRAERQPPPPPPERSFFEPVRLGGMLGGALGGAAAFELASRYLPKPLRTAGTVARLASRLGGGIGPRTARFAARAAGKTAAMGIRGPGVLAGAIAGGVAGQMGGEEIGAASYRMRGQEAPPGWDPPEREAGEELTRVGAGIGTQAVVSAAAKTALRGTVYGAIASLGVEELAGRAYAAAERRYGPEIAARVARGAMPTPTYI
jgi:hypothetical protein